MQPWCCTRMLWRLRSDIRQFAATRLAAFKVPHQVHIVEDLPKSPTGKLQRLGLAEKLGLTTPGQAQSTMYSRRYSSTHASGGGVGRALGPGARSRSVGIHDDFFQLGGDSILATQLISRVREAMHVEVLLPQLL